MESQIKSFPEKNKSKRIHLNENTYARDGKVTALRKGEKEWEREEHRYKKMAKNMNLSIITLNVNGLSAQIKIHRIAECIRNYYSHISCLQENHLRKNLHRLKVKGCKKYSRQMDRKKKPG